MKVIENKKSLSISQEDIMGLLDSCYDKCLNGIPNISSSVEKMASDYMAKYDSKERACQEMLKNQIIKCTTSGALSGLGGFISMPIAIPANISSVIYVQMRMIACTAYMAGFELDSDQTQTFVYACLAGISINEILKQAGIKFGLKFAKEMIEKIPGRVLIKINQKVGFRFLTKFGSTGVINFGKMIPGVGAIVGGGFDLVETKIIADRAYKWFFKDFE